MALVLADRVRETTTTTSTGAVTLGGAYTGFQTFSAAIGNANNTYYTIANIATGEWEVGIGTYTLSSNTLSRDTVLASSNAGSLVVFTAGTKDVFVTQPSSRAVYVNAANTQVSVPQLAATSITDSGLTSGRVTYATTAGLLTDSANLTFNGTTLTANTIGAFTLGGTIAGGGNQINNVIIGTTTPLAGSFTTLTASTSITNAGLTSGRVVYSTTGGLETDSANLTFNGTNLGVGTASANSPLTVGTPNTQTVAVKAQFNAATPSVASGSGIVQIGSTDTVAVDKGGVLTFTANTTTLNGYPMAGIAGKYETAGAGVYSGYLQFLTTSSAGSPTERMRIDSSGNVGIGTTAPSSKLEISDTSANGLRLKGAGDHAFGFTGYSGNAATQVFSIRNDGINNCYINTQSSCPLNFGVSTGTTFGSTTSQMQIISTGQVGINVSGAGGNTFRVVAVGSDNSVQFGTAGAGVYLTNGGTSFSTYSDIRLKNITGRYETALEDIAKLDAIKFTWKNDEGNKPQVGVSAQSIETVVPEAIARGTNFNAEGDTTEYLSVKYTELIPLMIASIQELKAINDTLTARIVALENR